MGLRLIYGKAGTGKSSFCFSEIKRRIDKEEKIIVITPEQFSFTAEKKLMDSIEKNAVFNAVVVTLSRMAHRVIQETGGKNKTQLTKCGKAMLIYSILNKYKKEFAYLGKTDENIDIIMRSITEFKQHGVSLEQLKKEVEENKDVQLKTKLKDIGIIYSAFEKQIQDTYIDETDQMTILAKEIENTDIIKNAVIYIDEFAGFTAQEYEVIKKFLKYAKQVNITVCTDELNESNNIETDTFYFNKKMAMKLTQIARENNYEIEDSVELKESYRFKTEELKHLEKNILEIKSQKYDKEVKNIDVFLAKNQYSEIEKVAKNITKQAKEKNLKYRDFAVISNEQEKYNSLIRAIFNKYEIPFFIDEKRELNQNIIVQYILAIIEILNSNFSQESIFNYLKLGFLPIDVKEIFMLENYCQKWGITRNKWKEKFSKGIEEEKEQVERYEELRKKIILPLIQLNKDIKEKKTAKNITICLYNFIQEQNIENTIQNKMEKLEEENLLDLSKEYKESYNAIIDIFDQIVLIFNDEKISLDLYLQIMKIGLKNTGLGKIPGTQDQVIIGDVERTRSHKVEEVYIIGLNDGIYPKIHKDEGFFNDLDREKLKENGIEMAKGTLENLYEENFNMYKVFSTAEKRIHISYASADGEGNTLRPSIYMSKIKRIFSNIKEESDVVKKEYEILNKTATYEELIENIYNLGNNSKIDDIWYEVYNYYKGQNDWFDKLQNDMKACSYSNIPVDISKNNVQKLYGNILKTSVSKLERYSSCPYSYFLQYGLKVKEKEQLQVHNFDTGTFMHEVIDEFFTEIYSDKQLVNNGLKKEKLNMLTEEEIEKLVDNIVEEKLKLSKNYIFTATAKYKMLVKRLKRLITKALKYIIEGLVNSDFSLENTEVEFGKNGEYQPITLTLDDGNQIEITGKIDRVDVAKNEDGNYLRIIDYKSSAKKINLNEVYAGLQIQLLTYMDAMCKAEDFLPAGILYFGLLEKNVQAKKRLTEEEIENEIRKSFKMQGLVLADVKVIKMHDNTLEKGSSCYVPAALTSNNTVRKDWTSGMNQEQFEVLQNYIYVVIKKIAKEILNGKIDLKPVNKGSIKPCDYCPYKAICGFDTNLKGNEYKFIDNKPDDMVIEKMKSLVGK